MPLSRAIVWMDSRQASVFRFGADELARDQLRADKPFLKVSHKAGCMRAGQPAEDLDFLDRVIDSLRGTRLVPGGPRQYQGRAGQLSRPVQGSRWAYCRASRPARQHFVYEPAHR